MGNSLLDIIVFGRNAGKQAAVRSKNIKTGKLTLEHIDHFAAEMAAAGIKDRYCFSQIASELCPQNYEMIGVD